LHNVREAIKAYGITMREVKSVLVMRKPRAGAKPKTTARKTTGAKRGRLRRNNLIKKSLENSTKNL